MSKKRVLWIDDECQRYDTVIERLRCLNIEVSCAYSVLEARDKLKELSTYDAVIADMILCYGERPGEHRRPGDDPMHPYLGLGIIQEILAATKPVPIPIIVLTIAHDPAVGRRLTEWETQGLIKTRIEKGVQDLDETVNIVAGVCQAAFEGNAAQSHGPID